MSNVTTPPPGRALGLGRGGRRLGAGVIAFGLLAFGAAACGSSGGSASSVSSSSTSPGAVNVSNVTLDIGDQAGAGSEALLTAAGLINKLPFKAKWSDFTSGPPMLQAMGAGSVDVGGVGDAPPVFAASGGDKVAVVAATVADPDSSAILVPQNSPIKTVAELKGKTIAVAQGSSSDYHMLAELTKAGLTVSEVKPQYLQPADAEAAFASGKVDAWDIWSPYIEQAESQYHARILVNGTNVSKVYSFEVASRAALANPAKAAAIGDYLKLLEQADNWAIAHPSVWAKTWASAFGLPVSVTTQAVKDDADTPVPINSTVISSEQSVANAFTAAGLIPSHVDFNDYAVETYNDLLRASG